MLGAKNVRFGKTFPPHSVCEFVHDALPKNLVIMPNIEQNFMPNNSQSDRDYAKASPFGQS
jgi:hypothetical protein